MEDFIDLVIIGAGLAGLTAAFHAQKNKINFLLCESSDRIGGSVWTEKLENNLIVERGPSSFAMGESLKELIFELGLSPIPTNPKAKKKLVYAGNTLYSVANPIDLFFKNGFLSLETKLAIVGESFKNSPVSPNQQQQDESVEAFFERRFNKEFVNNLIYPLISGIYAGDPAKLSIQAVFPRFAELEKKYGSLIGGFIQSSFEKNKKRSKRQTYSFEYGLGELISEIANYLPNDKICLDSPVVSISKDENNYFVHFKNQQQTKTLKAKKIILAVPAYRAAEIYPDYLADLKQIPYSSVTTLSIWLNNLSSSKREIIENSFGFLTARNQDLKLLGTIFNSALFSNRSPGNLFALTCFLGGINHSEIINCSESELKQICTNDLNKIFDNVELDYKAITYWKEAIPQYKLGHRSLVEKIQSKLPENFLLAGNYLNGVSLEEACNSGKLALQKIIECN